MPMLSARAKRDLLDGCARIRVGSLRLRTPEGEIHDFGAGEPCGEMQINNWAAVTALAAHGDAGLQQSYAAGLWDTPSIEDLASVVLRNLDHLRGAAEAGFWTRIRFRLLDRLMRGAALDRAAQSEAGNEFYQLWLDEGMTYSGAIFAPGDGDLHRAQMRKHDRVLDLLGPGERILEIGCGWGGFAERAADSGRHVTGLTVSPGHKGYADARLDGRAEIRLQDFRESSGQFDNVVSIEMIEWLGESRWPDYFATLKARLAPDGVAVIQATTVPDHDFDIYRRNPGFVRQRPAPGGLLLSEAVIADQAHRAGLVVRNSHAFGADYARTCTEWSARLARESRRIRRLGFGEAFLRHWRYTLGACTAAFAVGQTDVMQIELVHG